MIFEVLNRVQDDVQTLNIILKLFQPAPLPGERLVHRLDSLGACIAPKRPRQLQKV